MINNIFGLVKALCETNGKIIVGGLFIVHSLIFNLEKGIEQFISEVGGFIVQAISSGDVDENSCRFACGLVSDLSNYLEKNMKDYAGSFIDSLNKCVIRNPNLSPETKLHAMIALGDLCLAIENEF
jgi:hypothetical protein